MSIRFPGPTAVRQLAPSSIASMDSARRSVALVAGTLAVMVVVLAVLGTSGAAALASDQCARPCHGEVEGLGEEPHGSPDACVHTEACGGGAGASSAVPLALMAPLGVLVPPLAAVRSRAELPLMRTGSMIGSGIDHPPRSAA